MERKAHLLEGQADSRVRPLATATNSEILGEPSGLASVKRRIEVLAALSSLWLHCFCSLFFE
jgi:hypothetical protein